MQFYLQWYLQWVLCVKKVLSNAHHFFCNTTQKNGFANGRQLLIFALADDDNPFAISFTLSIQLYRFALEVHCTFAFHLHWTSKANGMQFLSLPLLW
jgi:hypothetical protein